MNLKKTFIKNKNKIALIEKNLEITYAELLNEINKIFSFLHKKKFLILLTSNNTKEFIAIYAGSLINNKTPLLIDQNTDEISLSNIINLYKPKYVFIKKKNNFKKFKTIYKFEEYVIVETNFKQKVILNKNLALLLSTSGSISSPKLVRISYKNLFDNTEKIKNYLKIKSQDVVITTLNPSYSYGISIINTHLSAGAKIILNNNSVVNKHFWDLFKIYRPVSFSGVPSTFEILDKLGYHKLPFEKLNYMTCAGGKLKKEIQIKLSRFCKNKKINFYNMYGQTEASPRMSYLNPKEFDKKYESIGKPIKGGSFKLKNTFIVNKKLVGEIIYKGKNVCLGYANKLSDLKKGDENRGKLNTGDLAYRDKDGFYFIIGRKDRNIKIYGNRFNLDEIEKKLQEININCACIKKNEKIILFSVISKGKIINYLKNILKLNLNFFSIKKIKAIPLNKNKKVNYNILKRYA